MTGAAGIAGRGLRALVALALALSWLLTAGTPAGAAVADYGVETPQPDAVLTSAQQLVVWVDRAAPAPEEQVEVRTRIVDAEGQRVGQVVSLQFLDRTEQPGGDRLRFGGTIDPAAFAWFGGTAAANGTYQLEYRPIVTVGDMTRGREWRPYSFVLDAPPAAPAKPTAAVADAAAKRMRISWQANAEPDLARYTVHRRRQGGGGWEVAAATVNPDRTTITDTVAQHGTYRYRVTAYRPAGQGDGERLAVSEPSEPVVLTPPEAPAPRGADPTEAPPPAAGPRPGSDVSVHVPRSGGSSTGGSQSSGSFSVPMLRSTEQAQAPDVDMSYRGPLDYGVEPREVTERVPVDIARGGAASEDDSVLRILNRSVDQQRVLPPLAGGLILVVSAAHVLRYLNE
ncbi:MAG TPA: fibronectin type III domain-containing protein [Egibacteraceae bacterium]|nr:fibronectin type III domain-containing protein [Egibacteraceae bacterium]